ncbi:phosphoesterase-domain-containing protein [Penicillium chermesinum]|uniref:acid phosphatase n=1 Tax=Penicillium chermesinum TaxID=63820 RepID=A0A9W9TBZ8_9EURO|nr:phosphoesterase-domain-containing protein [Penicillium chermesinum]KAJ5217128.1 phosphoesterase-domain-containing protein [Penicillium chermesinum]KAJ6171252.1 phosphoesterase-domain-containing protein [Penicillium chermesinum]
MASVTALLALAGMAGMAAGATITTTEPSLADIKAAQATTVPQTWTSNIEGKAFNRFYQIWLENVDFVDAAKDPNQKWLAKQGIELTNFYAVGHPSQPNYVATASGDNYGMDNDDFHNIPANVSTIADLLNTKGISYAEYQEHLPYPGFQGFNYSNQETYANDYVRKHSPLVSFESFTANDTALRLLKNFTSFYDDLHNKELPQWAFITPNMTNDAHDTNITFGSTWLRGFVEGLMNNTYFWDNTLLLLTFDETETYGVPYDEAYADQNRIFSVLLGGAVPKDLIGTKDSTFYTHYSTIASVEANWGLPSLGRWDCGANLLKLVADKVGYTNWDVDTTNLWLNESLPGPLSEDKLSHYRASWPVPTTNATCSSGHGILKSVVDAYKHQAPTYNYTAPLPHDAAYGLDVNIPYSRHGTTYVTGVNSTGTIAFDKSSNSSATGSSSSSAHSSTATGNGAVSASTVSAGLPVAAMVAALVNFL